MKERRVYAVSLARVNGQTPVATSAEFRKATRNMLLAHAAMSEALTPLQPWLEKHGTHDFGMVLGSSHGELEVTMRFLVTLAETKVARPLLFQNSLHNSTTGFLAQTWPQTSLTGPAFTVSNSYFTGEDALDTGALLINEGQCRFCLVVGVDARVPELIPGLEKSGVPQSAWGEGAAAIVLCSSEGLALAGLQPISELAGVQYSRGGPRPMGGDSGFQDFYDSNAIDHCVQQLRTSSACELDLKKPDGCRSHVVWKNPTP
jgi:3-oxoacyl-(acyl-carrier-protein) synthase